MFFIEPGVFIVILTVFRREVIMKIDYLLHTPYPRLSKHLSVNIMKGYKNEQHSLHMLPQVSIRHAPSTHKESFLHLRIILVYLRSYDPINASS